MLLQRPSTSTLLKAVSGSPLPKTGKHTDNLVSLAFHQTAGLGISGDNGTGKSELLRHINRQAVSSGQYSVICLDPPGDLAKDCAADNLDYSEAIASRTHYYAPGNTTLPSFTINPLSVDPSRYTTKYQLESALACRSHHAALLFPAVFGQEGWDNTPQMYTVLTAETGSLARMLAPLAAIRNFFDDSPSHETFIENLPFPSVKNQFQQYLSVPAAERAKLTSSAHNRVKALLFSSPIITSLVSSTKGCWSTRQVLDKQEFHYFDLGTYGNLEEFHQKLILQFLLSDIIFTVLSTPPAERKPLLVIADEAPVICSGC